MTQLPCLQLALLACLCLVAHSTPCPADDCVQRLADATPQGDASRSLLGRRNTTHGDWLKTGVFYKPNLTDAQRGYFVTIGMTSESDCASINNRTILTLYVGPDSHSTCQGWNHYPNAYPDTSRPHQNSAVAVQCVDGGVTYAQHINIDCAGFATQKTDQYRNCKQGHPPTVYTEILDFSGCLKQGFSPNVTSKSTIA